MVLSQEEARILCHAYFGTEHLLLGLLRAERGVAARVLESVGVNLDSLRMQVEVIVGGGDQPPSGHLPFTANAQEALYRSARLASTFANAWIDTEHLLLALIGGYENTALRALRASNVDLDTLRVVLIARATSSDLTRSPD